MTEPVESRKPRAAKRKASELAPAERPRIGAARAISDLMPDIGRAAFRKFGFIQSSVATRWAEIVGQRYASLTAPESIRFPTGKRSGGTLRNSDATIGRLSMRMPADEPPMASTRGRCSAARRRPAMISLKW